MNSSGGFSFVWPIAGVDDRALVHAAALSAFSVDHFHPEAEKIFLVPDDEFEKIYADIPQWIKETVVICPVFPPREFRDQLFRSRWIKTHAFGILQRDVLLLDTDTLMVAPLSLPDLNRVGAVGAARDRVGVNFEEIHYRKEAENLFQLAGWTWPNYCENCYFNTGVIVYRHNPAAIAFAHRWEVEWENFVERTRLYFDQAAFNHVSSKTRSVTEMPVAYNVPVAILPRLASNARIYHYYSSGNRIENLRCHLMGAVLARSLEDPSFSPELLGRRLRNRLHPYVAAGLPSQAYRDSRQTILFLRARAVELPPEVFSRLVGFAAMARTRFRLALRSLPPSLRRLGRVIRDGFSRKG